MFLFFKRLWLLLSLCPLLVLAQSPRQTVKGIVLDKTTRQALIGVTVQLTSTKPVLGATTDAEGRFKIERVPIGKHAFKASFVGYQDAFLDVVEVRPSKQTELSIELIETAQDLNEVTIVARQPNAPLNEMSVVSTRSFSVEETERYAASINDPSRLVAGFAGVQTTQDNNNDIIVRGNAAVGVLWRLEGVDIPNPNHFARPGSSGGGISAFSAALLANSDFSSGAFAAEYGNALSSVFDMKFRHGNTEAQAYRAKLSLIGLEVGAEGPFQKAQSAYLVNYRYSTLGLLSKLGFNFVSERTLNEFQDLSFNLYFPSKNRKTEWTVFGFGGTSLEQRIPAKCFREWNPETCTDIPVVNGVPQYRHSDRSRYQFKTNLAVLGTTHTLLIDAKSFLKTTLALMWSENAIIHDTLTNNQVAGITSNHIAKDARISLASHYSRKLSHRTTLKSGLNASFFRYQALKDRILRGGIQDLWVDAQGTTNQLDLYTQTKTSFSPRLSLLAGLHYLRFGLNGSSALEPRAALIAQVSPKATTTLAYGLHSRILPIGLYWTINLAEYANACNDCLYPNKNLPLAKAHHFVISQELAPREKVRLRLEAYMQNLFDVPVSKNPASTYWFLNETEGFGQRNLTTGGKGKNQGLDLTFEQFYTRRFFLLATGSLYKASYELPDGRVFPSAYDNGYTSSVMGGKEFEFRKGGVLQIGARFMRTGGNRFTPPNIAESKRLLTFIPDETRPYGARVPDYMRLDGRIAYTRNRAARNAVVSLDIFNMTNRVNNQSQVFDATSGTFTYNRQSEFTPVLSYELHF